MQDAFVSGWGRESHLTAEILASVRGLNHRFLDLAGARAAAWRAAGRGGAADLAGQVAPLSAAQREAAASCPYTLFDLRFQDDEYWQLRLQNTGCRQVADAAPIDEETANFVQLALFYAWHVASTARLAAQLLLGMNCETVAAFRRTPVNSLPALVSTEAVNLTARWSHCGAYWNALVGAASRPDPAGLRRVQLYGLQLAAAARLDPKNARGLRATPHEV
jgi:hypothetical protein